MTGAQWKGWNGALVIACLKGSELFGLVFDATGTRATVTSPTLTDHGRLRTPAVGPDGALYVTTANGGDEILRLVPQ